MKKRRKVMENLCPQCGAPITPGATNCQYCGAVMPVQATAQPQQPQYVAPQPQYVAPQPQFVQPQYVPPQFVQPQNHTGNPAIHSSWPIKNKVAAGILGILFGGLGIHKFYLGKTGAGILSILFCWTYIPSILGLIEGIMILCSNDENFQLKYQVRI